MFLRHCFLTYRKLRKIARVSKTLMCGGLRRRWRRVQPASDCRQKAILPLEGRIALSANERIAEFLDFAIQAKFAYVNKLRQAQSAFLTYRKLHKIARMSKTLMCGGLRRKWRRAQPAFLWKNARRTLMCAALRFWTFNWTQAHWMWLWSFGQFSAEFLCFCICRKMSETVVFVDLSHWQEFVATVK